MIRNYPCPGVISIEHPLPFSGKNKEVRTIFSFFKERSRAVVAALLMLISFSASATHIVGGMLTYVYNGANSYTVTLVLYRDCDPASTAYPASVAVTVLDAEGNLFSPSRNFTL